MQTSAPSRPGTPRSRTEESSSRFSPRLLPFVGRGRQTGMVRDFLRTTFAGDSVGLLWLQGEAGVGKSRFLDHVQRELDAEEGTLVLYIRIYPDSAGSLVPAFGSAIAEHPTLQSLLPNRPIRTMSDLVSSLQRTSRLRPTMLVVDDVHLLEADSALELVELIESLSNEPIGVVCSARPGASTVYGMFRRFRMQEIEVGPLNYEEIREVVRSCYGEDFDDDITLARIYEATHGIPLILRAAMADCLHRGPGADSVLYLEPTISPPPGFHARARFATEALVSCLMADLEVSEREKAAQLATLGEVFSVRTARAFLGEGADEFLAKLVDFAVLTPALGQPQPLVPGSDETGGRKKGDELLAFAHTLLHEHLTSTAPTFRLDGLLDTIEAGHPLYSIHPLLRIADASLESAERGVRILSEFVDTLSDSINRILATPTYNAAVSLYERHAHALDESVRLDMRLDLIRLRLQITSHIAQHPEFESTLTELLDETEGPHDAALARHRLGALEFATYRPTPTLEARLRSCLDEAETIVDSWPELRSDRRYLRLLGTIAGATRACPEAGILERIRALLDALLANPSIDADARREALVWVAAPILSVFATPEDLDDRRELAALIEEEFGAAPKEGRLLSLWPQFLEASGEMTRARIALENHIMTPVRGYNLPEELSLRMLALSADAALGRPLATIERSARELLEETFELFPGPEGEQMRDLVRSSVSAYLVLIGLLRGDPAWSERTIARLTGIDRNDNHYLAFERAAVAGERERLALLYESGSVPDIYRPLVYVLLSDGTDESPEESAPELSTRDEEGPLVGALRGILREPIFRRQDILRLHVALGLAEAGLETGRLASRAMKRELREPIEKGLEWCSTHSLPGYLDALLRSDRGILRKSQREKWKSLHDDLVAEISVLPIYYGYTEEDADDRTPLSMIGKIGWRDGDGTFHRISGARARHVLGLLTIQELRRTPFELDEFRRLATGMETGDEGANYLRIILARLRRVLGSESILNSSDALAPRLNLDEVRLDVVEAARYLKKGRTAARHATPREAFAAISKGLGLVGGHTLLPTLYDDVFEESRRDFEILVRESSLELVERLQDEEDDEQAIRLLRLAAAALPGDEEISELLTEQLQLVGHHLEAWQNEGVGRLDEN